MSDTSPASNQPLFRWPLPLGFVWICIPIAGTVAAASLVPISPYDYWWHLVMGRYIDVVGAIPTENLFLYTMPDAAGYFDQPWLGQWLMFTLRESAGDAGLHITRNILVALTWIVLMWGALRRRVSPQVVGVCAMLGVLLSGRIYGVRTQMFALLPYAILLVLLVELVEERIRYHAGWIMLLVGAFWANVHGSFVLLPVLTAVVGLSVLFEGWRSEETSIGGRVGVWSASLTGGVVGTLLNPHGVEVYAYVVRLSLFSTVSETVSEWQPVDPSTPVGVIFVTSLVAGTAVLIWRRDEVRLWEALLWAAATFLASSALRNLYWWAAVFVVVVPVHATALTSRMFSEDRQPSTMQGIINAALVIVCLAVPVAVQPGGPAHEQLTSRFVSSARSVPPGRGLMSRDNPLRLVDMVRREQGSGQIFHAQEVGGLLEYALADAGGERVAFVDQRLEMVPERVWREYFDVVEARSGWKQIVVKHEIDTMLLNTELHWPIIQELQRSSNWKLVGIDQKHLLFVWEGGATPRR